MWLAYLHTWGEKREARAPIGGVAAAAGVD
jgi:hypothetical protein